MTSPIRRTALGLALVGALSSVGCQTYQLGQALPSPYAPLYDDIQYFPKGPEFPLQNELNAMQVAEQERAAGR
ncbi:MAG TPA: hypothetical protein VNC50_13975 [Planctomycetia bacterium]|nr:hypothetical protein [Planctomycetia bacterium]